jgi:hypothetical protein
LKPDGSLPKRVLGLVILFLALAGTAFAGSSYKVIYRFPNGRGGEAPYALIVANDGGFYGTALDGDSGYGTVFKLTPPGKDGGGWTRTVLHGFRNGHPGGTGSLVLDSTGNLYGVTPEGGKGCGIFGCGMVFELTPPAKKGGRWTYTVLYAFHAWNGYQPESLVLDREGNLYGTTWGGGRGCGGFGCGTIFKLLRPVRGKKWKREVLYFFKGVPGGSGDGDGAEPIGITFDQEGDLYGITQGGGSCSSGSCYGTAFELKPPSGKRHSWTEKVLYRFSWDLNSQPNSGVVMDKSGALYATTWDSVYQLEKVNGVWTQNVLADEDYDYSGVVLDDQGNVYGTSGYSSQYNNGVVFELSPSSGESDWMETVLHGFTGDPDGSDPEGGVIFGKDGALYGTTLGGGDNNCPGSTGCGTVFRVAP